MDADNPDGVDFVTDERTVITGNLQGLLGYVETAEFTPFYLFSVNNYQRAVNSTVQLVSGALLTVSDTGDFVYDPAGSFDGLDDGEIQLDSFTVIGSARTFPNGYSFTQTVSVRVEVKGLIGSVAGDREPFDILLGSGLADVLKGTAHTDTIFAWEGDDTIDPGDGADMIDGDAGHDTVVYDGIRSEYTVELQDNGMISVFDLNGEVDVIRNVERFRFEDGALLYDEEIERQSLEMVYRFYAAGLGRAADEDGLRFWAQKIDNLRKINALDGVEKFLSSGFLGSAEFQMLHGPSESHSDFVDSMYLNGLGRHPDTEGRAFWTSALNQGLGYDDLLTAFALSDELGDRIGPDLDDGIWVVV